MSEAKKQDTDMSDRIGFGLTFKSANNGGEDGYPVAYMEDLWDVVTENSPTRNIVGYPGQYDQHTVNEELAKKVNKSVTTDDVEFGYTDWWVAKETDGNPDASYYVEETTENETPVWGLFKKPTTESGESTLVATVEMDEIATELTFTATSDGIATIYSAYRTKLVSDKDLIFAPGSANFSAKQKHRSSIAGINVTTDVFSESGTSIGAGNTVGLKGYRYINTGSVANSLTFEVTPDGWAVGDVVSIINKDKYSDVATIESINGNVVTFTAPLNIGTEFIDESDFDSKCAYVSAKPGVGNVDLGVGAHAEGVCTSAINTVAHAEGRDTVASGQYSHAEGRGTSAKNYIAHAEGHDTVAKGMTSHAEGYKTTANGNNSHSEGRETKTSGANSHAENYRTSASGENSHAEGAQSRTGGADKPLPVTVFANSGYAAHAEGNGTWATGSSSHAEGYSTVASALAAHAEGNQTVASGQNSHASGLKSIAEGYASTAMGRSAHAMHDRSFVWQGLDTDTQYHSHNIGSININPAPANGSIDPATGFWIGEKTLAQRLAEASPAITQVNADWNSEEGVSKILNKPAFPLSIENGGTGANTAAKACANLGALSRDEAEKGFTEWSLEDGATPSGLQLSGQPYIARDGGETYWAVPLAHIGNIRIGGTPADTDATSLSWHGQKEGIEVSFTVARTRLPTMADIPALAAPSTDAGAAGKAADAKATGDALAEKAPWMVPYRIDGKLMRGYGTGIGSSGRYLVFEDEEHDVLITYSPATGLFATDTQDTPDFRYDWEVSEDDLILYRDGAEYIRYPYEERPVALTPEVIAPASIEEAAGKAADAYATGTSLASKASAEDVGLTAVYSDTPTFSEWTISPSGKFTEVIWISEGGDFQWCLSFDDYPIYTANLDPNATSISAEDGDGTIYTATRTRTDIIGYQLGSQEDKPLAPAGDYALKGDVPPVVPPSPSATTGQAADAKATGEQLESIQFKEWFPGGEAKSISDCTPNLKFDWENADEANHTVVVLPFCNTGDPTKDNSNFEGTVIIPPYAYDETTGVKYTVVGVAVGVASEDSNATLTGVVAPTTLTNIGDSAFTNCTSLTSVSFPAATAIGVEAFYSCTALATVSLPTATDIAHNAFTSCDALTTVFLPAATNIGYSAFSWCTNLTAVSLPAATTIEEAAFNGCAALATVSLPVAATIEREAFFECAALVTVSLPAATDIGDSAFTDCNSLTSVSLPVATSIGSYAFSPCKSLTTVTLPAVTDIGEGAFDECTSLTTVDFGPDTRQDFPTPTPGIVFPTLTEHTCKIVVPDGNYDVWSTEPEWAALKSQGYQFTKSGGIYLKDANGIYWELTIGTDGVIGAIAANNLA